MSENQHGNTGNKHAMRGKVPIDDRVAFRIPSALKARAEAEAEKAGITPSQWYTKAIERALG